MEEQSNAQGGARDGGVRRAGEAALRAAPVEPVKVGSGWAMAGLGWRARGDRPRRRRPSPLWNTVLLAIVGLGLAAYAGLWLDTPVRRVLAETVLTSQHHGWAALIATPGEMRRWSRSWAETPDVTVVTPVPAQPASGPLTLSTVNGPGYHGWLLTVPDPKRIILGTSDRLGNYGERTSVMAPRYGALAGVNGGGFMDPYGEGYGGAPIGVTMSEGRVVPADPDDTSDYVIGFNLQDQLVVGKWNIAQSRALGIRDGVSFKPLLISGGLPEITTGDGGWGIGPRTAIGQRADGTVLFLVIDGRQAGSLGATLRQVQGILLAHGAVTAANLDGGSSTVLWKDGAVVNHPASPFGERTIPDAFLIMPPTFNADAVAGPNLAANAQVHAVPGPIAPPPPPPVRSAGAGCEPGHIAAASQGSATAWAVSATCAGGPPLASRPGASTKGASTPTGTAGHPAAATSAAAAAGPSAPATSTASASGPSATGAAPAPSPSSAPAPAGTSRPGVSASHP